MSDILLQCCFRLIFLRHLRNLGSWQRAVLRTHFLGLWDQARCVFANNFVHVTDLLPVLDVLKIFWNLRRLLSCGMWHHVVWWDSIDFSEEAAASIFWITLSSTEFPLIVTCSNEISGIRTWVLNTVNKMKDHFTLYGASAVHLPS